MAAAASPGRPSRNHLASSPATHFNADSPRKRRKHGTPSAWPATNDLQTPRPRNPPGRPRSSRPVGRPRTVGRPRRHPIPQQPMRNSTSAEAAAAIQSDGYKPREERGWEEFHPDLDIDSDLIVFTADEVDGVPAGVPNKDGTPLPSATPPNIAEGDGAEASVVQAATSILSTPPPKRRPGRPPRRPENMLFGLGSPTPPRITPLPAQNPRERLNLPKPSYRRVDTFQAYDADRDINMANFVDRPMAAVGYQETDKYLKKDRAIVRLYGSRADDDGEPNLVLESDQVDPTAPPPARVSRVEYDMDEQDQQWLDAINIHRKEDQTEAIKPALFEITMTQIEKEWHALEKRIPKPNPKPPQTHRPRSSSAAAVNGEPAGEEQDSKCAVCDDGDCENTNAIVFCDGCDLAVHQECYGVPFIPEGQWLCRKCQFIGRSVPTCIFCPNTEGAFKLTTQQKWVHLLCSIWIPEVSIANTTFMEPIDGVQSVPKNRWKLLCYICNQRMGACIQCANRSCFAAFHVTCARRAKLFLKMKSAHGGPASLDSSVLKALCDKHVPQEWRQQHDVDTATAEAKAFYRRTLRGRRWADSASAALSQNVVPQAAAFESVEETNDGTEQAKESAAQKRKKLLALQKNVWRLPSGAPIVPVPVFTAVENALSKFAVRKRKEFVAEACKYWTLKREARRGAALLKRLQLQMETFSTTEITRRNFSAMGASGGPKLQRRIAFADQMLKDLEHVREICEVIKEREALKLQDAEMLTRTMDAIYFPVIALLWPILEKAVSLDPKNVFTVGFKELHAKLEDRDYTSVASFSVDLGAVFKSIAGLDTIHDAVEAHNQLRTAPPRDGTLTNDEREAKKLAKRIIKAIQEPLQDAMMKEAELSGRPFEKEMAKLGMFLNGAGVDDHELPLLSSRMTEDATGDAMEIDDVKPSMNGESGESINRTNGDLAAASPTLTANGTSPKQEPSKQTAGKITTVGPSAEIPPTPPGSEKNILTPFEAGGRPWYLEPFDIQGTTVQEERWTGREVLRDMSEPLSELDEEELAGLGGGVAAAEEQGEPAKETTPKKAALRKRRRHYR